MKSICILLFATILITSCSTSYIPNSINNPLFKKKNELQVSANLSLSNFAFAVEPQLAYAINDKIGVIINGNYTLNNYDKRDTLYFKRSFTEIGIGHFKKFSPNFQYEVFGGFGIAKINERYTSDESIAPIENSSNYHRYFVQPTIAYINRRVAIAFTSRINYVDFKRTSASINNSIVIDPVLSFQFGEKFIFQNQIGGSIFLKQFNADYNPFIYTMGLKYKF